ncbi:hypothetical protein ADL00_19000 [Streptomyces sp. AS58]|uniref:hypothetical protein n=1 Tax=Streptomyces sp. AS58 TaxID=1519489 RepID=UPI0006AF318A|nr:hypothetical protein [Streptomyces sp. AS58]KOV65676.1 hypothetical protein ADL00_19000 [Streptomyces sp. AS58]
MSTSIKLETLLEGGSITPETVVKWICSDPALSAVVGTSIAYRSHQKAHADNPHFPEDYTGSSEWKVKATEYLLMCSLKEYARRVEEETERN